MRRSLIILGLTLVLQVQSGDQIDSVNQEEESINNLTRIFKNPPESYSNTLGTIKVVAYSVIANFIVGVGLIGNLLNLVVLTRPNLKGVMYVYLLGLAVSNLCVLLSALPGLYDISVGLEDGYYCTAFYQAHLKLPIINTFMASSVYIIICMTVNRYISIYKPTQFQRIHTHKNARISIFSSFFGGLLLNIPLCFQQEVVCKEDYKLGNDTCQYWISVENDRIAVIMQVYTLVSETILRFGPIITLAILNSMIIYKFQQLAKKRQRLKGYTGARSSRIGTPPSSPSPSNVISSATHLSRISISHDGHLLDKVTEIKAPVARTKSSRTSTRRRSLQSPEERMLVIVLISIVVLFVCCTTPAAILSIIFTAKLQSNSGFQIFRAVANNLELLNFALNFYIYCLCSAEIRRAFVSLFMNIVNLVRENKEAHPKVTFEETKK